MLMLCARKLRLSLSAPARPFSSRAPAPPPAANPTTTSKGSSSSSSGGGGEGRDTLGRRLLSLIYPKRSAVIVLRKWAEEGKIIQKYQLNRVVRELRMYKRYKHALEICEWMTTQPDMKLLPGDYAVHLDLVAKVRGLSSAEKFFEDLPQRMKGQSTCTALLHTYVQNKLSSKAESLLEEMSTNGFLTCPLSYNHMLTLYVSNGEPEKVPKLIRELKRNTMPNEFTYNLWLSSCANNDDTKSAEEVFLEMQNRKIAADWVTYSTLTNMYIKAGHHDKAKEALKEMEKKVSRKNRTAYCSLISLYASLPDREHVYRIWSKMKSIFRKLSDAEYKCMLSSLTKLGDIEEAEAIYREWELVSGTRDSRIPNTLLAFYIKSDMEKAEEFHNHTIQAGIKPCYSTWELLAWGYLTKNRMDKVLECLSRALSGLQKWKPNSRLAVGVFNKMEKLGDVEGGEKFLVMLREAGYVTTEIYNSLLKIYVKAGRMPLIISERMRKDNVVMDDETKRLLKLTSNLCVADVSNLVS